MKKKPAETDARRDDARRKSDMLTKDSVPAVPYQWEPVTSLVATRPQQDGTKKAEPVNFFVK
jgi:hypothetical protein